MEAVDHGSRVARPKERARWVAVWLILLLALLAVPFAWWRVLPVTPLAVLVMDKTVPADDYREHRGVLWVLNHRRYRDPAIGGPFDPAEHYAGFVPQPGRRYLIRPLERPERRLDLVYLADTYGVYTAEYYGAGERGARSRLIHGGLEPAELDALAPLLGDTTTFIAEFNTLADPTPAAARGRLERMLGVRWSGWTGRRFESLDRDVEVPPWLIENWERSHGARWTVAGPGYALVHHDGRVEVLREPDDVPRHGLVVRFTNGAARRLGVANAVPYSYWFDVVAADSGTAVLASYELTLSDGGRAIFARTGLPARFPAVVERDSGPSRRLYFAGDYADNPLVPAIYGAVGVTRWKRFLARLRAGEDAFYWRVYEPMLRTLLAEQVARRPTSAAAATR